jgi:peroxiredoxin
MTQPTRLGPQLQPGDSAPDISLTATDGSSIQIASLWNGAPVVLAFLRHFG